MRDFVLSFDAMVLTDLMILAIHASEITVAEEDVADAVRSHEARLLTEMRTICRDDRKIPRVATSNLILQPVHIAVKRTNVAGGKHRFQSCRSSGQLPKAVKLQVARLFQHYSGRFIYRHLTCEDFVKKLQKDMKKKVLIQLVRNYLQENVYASASRETGFFGTRLDGKAVNLGD
jgi:hypothetical protein